MGHIVAIVNQKGGVGKTTTAVNVAAGLAMNKQKVLLVDLDPQGNATSGLGQEAKGNKSIYSVLLGQTMAHLAVVPTTVPSLFLLPANGQLAGAEVELVGTIARETHLKRALEPLKAQYDWILLDCPPSVGLLTVNALSAASFLLIPMQCEYYALEGLGHLLETVKLIRQALNPCLEVAGIVLTMLDQRNNLSKQVALEVEKHFPQWVFKTAIPRNVRVSEAPSHGKPVLLHDRQSKGSKAYQALCKELQKRLKSKPATQSDAQGATA